ncbi:hypothetical protein BASA81_010273 [Batrachochytrium salamandrivorans]|nr:hypothetical protein BASA81_010273 [Batrachochytrium salamandrivorans]
MRAIRFPKRLGRDARHEYAPVTSAIRFRVKEKPVVKTYPLAVLPKPTLMNSVRIAIAANPPAALTRKLHEILAPHSLRKLTHDFECLTKDTLEFERTENSGKIPRYDSKKSLAYMAFRMVPAFGCITTALTRLKDTGFALPNRPITVLDFGSGPGTASWAVLDALHPQQMEATFIENSLPMIDAAKKLAEGNFEANWARNLLELSRSYTKQNAGRYDVVMCSFALGDLASNEARQLIVDVLWTFVRPNGGVLVIVERGTRRGSRIVGTARQQIINGGQGDFDSSSLFKSDHSPHNEETPSYAHVLAPCGHERTCPLLDSNPVAPIGLDLDNAAPSSLYCHFVQSTARLLKTTTSVRSSHFVSYSYVAIQKMTEESTKASRHQAFVRVLAPPKRRVNHVLMDLCGEWDGQVRQTITRKKHGKLRYRRARKAEAGELFPRSERTAPQKRW